MTYKNWKLVAELGAVSEGTHRAMPKWEVGVPHCREDGCPHYDGKRCELLGGRPGALCEPAVSGMAAVLDRRYERDQAALSNAWCEGVDAAIEGLPGGDEYASAINAHVDALVNPYAAVKEGGGGT